MAVLHDPYHQAVGPEWTLWAAAGLFCLVLGVCILLVAHFNRRDARAHALWHEFWAARGQFMSAGAEIYQARSVRSETFIRIVTLGQKSLQAFERAKAVWPDLEPDADWLNSLRWVELKAKKIVSGGQ